MINPFTLRPYNDGVYSGLVWEFPCFLNNETYGKIRAEVVDILMHVHANLYICNKHTLKEIKKDLYDAFYPIAEYYEFDDVYVSTPFPKLLKHLTDFPYEKVAETSGMEIFKIRIKDGN